MESNILCPVCHNGVASWNSYFGGYFCCECNAFIQDGVSKCHLSKDCINVNSDFCKICSHAPDYMVRRDYYQTYEPTCPIGMPDCVCDPAYIKRFNPEWYEDLYGTMTVAEVVEKHCKPYIMDGHWCTAYDDEDK